MNDLWPYRAYPNGHNEFRPTTSPQCSKWSNAVFLSSYHRTGIRSEMRYIALETFFSLNMTSPICQTCVLSCMYKLKVDNITVFLKRGFSTVFVCYFYCFERDSWDLIRRLLVVDSKRRYTAAQVLHHRWLSSFYPVK